VVVDWHAVDVLLADLTATSDAVRDSSARTAKIERLAATLRRLGLGEVAIGVAYLSGELRQRPTHRRRAARLWPLSTAGPRDPSRSS
jgi:hypothetical protein